MQVIELQPSGGNSPGGWYTEILAPYLKNNGLLIAAHFNPKESEWRAQMRKGYEKRIENNEDFNKIQNHTLVMTGEHDIGSTVKMSQELNALIPKSQLKIIKDGKHLCGIECADDVNSILNSFIKDNE